MSEKIKEDRIFGENAVKAFYNKREQDLIRLFVRNGEQGRFKNILSDCAKKKKLYRLVSEEELSKISQSTHHEGICAVVKPKLYQPLPQLIESYLTDFKWQPLIILDSVNNPHNIGAIIRSAVFFGIERIVINSMTKLSLSGSLARTSEGALEFLTLAYSANTTKLIEMLKERKIQIISTDVHSTKKVVAPKSMDRPFALVLGNENSGISKEFKEKSDFFFKLNGTKHVESLNVSVFAGVMFNEFFKINNSK